MSVIIYFRSRSRCTSLRNSPAAHDVPVVSFLLESHELYLLPVTGSDTQWYQNVLKTPAVHIRADGTESEVTVTPLTERTQVSSVIEKFRARYGDSGMKYFSKLNVAAVCALGG